MNFIKWTYKNARAIFKPDKAKRIRPMQVLTVSGKEIYNKKFKTAATVSIAAVFLCQLNFLYKSLR
jgi:hypothetical protein